jgi:hypothetical protein
MSTNEPVLMACNHVANGTDGLGNPVCVMCTGFTPNASIIASKDDIDLSNRMAKCAEGRCSNQQPSSFKLAFFNYHPTSNTDSYYCGCRGWE